MPLNRKTACNECSAEFEIVPLSEDVPIEYCPSCGSELEQEEDDTGAFDEDE